MTFDSFINSVTQPLIDGRQVAELASQMARIREQQQKLQLEAAKIVSAQRAQRLDNLTKLTAASIDSRGEIDTQQEQLLRIGLGSPGAILAAGQSENYRASLLDPRTRDQALSQAPQLDVDQSIRMQKSIRSRLRNLYTSRYGKPTLERMSIPHLGDEGITDSYEDVEESITGLVESFDSDQLLPSLFDEDELANMRQEMRSSLERVSTDATNIERIHAAVTSPRGQSLQGAASTDSDMLRALDVYAQVELVPLLADPEAPIAQKVGRLSEFVERTGVLPPSAGRWLNSALDDPRTSYHAALTVTSLHRDLPGALNLAQGQSTATITGDQAKALVYRGISAKALDRAFMITRHAGAGYTDAEAVEATARAMAPDESREGLLGSEWDSEKKKRIDKDDIQSALSSGIVLSDVYESEIDDDLVIQANTAYRDSYIRTGGDWEAAKQSALAQLSKGGLALTNVGGVARPMKHPPEVVHGKWAVSHLEKIAEELNLDPSELRLKPVRDGEGYIVKGADGRFIPLWTKDDKLNERLGLHPTGLYRPRYDITESHQHEKHARSINMVRGAIRRFDALERSLSTRIMPTDTVGRRRTQEEIDRLFLERAAITPWIRMRRRRLAKVLDKAAKDPAYDPSEEVGRIDLLSEPISGVRQQAMEWIVGKGKDDDFVTPDLVRDVRAFLDNMPKPQPVGRHEPRMLPE